MRWGVPIGCVLACAACSLFTELDGYDNDGPNQASDASAEGASSDGGITGDDATGGGSDAGATDTQAADGAPPAGLLSNAGFESSGITCGPDWQADQGTATTSTFARSGLKSCKVCVPAGGGFGMAYATLPFQAGQWSMQAQFHAPESGLAMAGGRVDIAFYFNQNLVDNETGGNPLGNGWTPMQTLVASPSAPVNRVQFAIGGDGLDGACVLVDDVVVERF